MTAEQRLFYVLLCALAVSGTVMVSLAVMIVVRSL